MKSRYLLGIGIFWLFISACSEDYMSYEGTDRIQFKTKAGEVYTFAYSQESKRTDTVNVEIVTMGEVENYPRKIKFKQMTKEWQYIYDEENPALVVDSNYTDMAYPAVAGVHFEAFSENNELVIPAHQNGLKLRIVVKRDPSMQNNAYKLQLCLLPSEDFETGEPANLVKTITLSDKLERPSKWKDQSYYYKLYLGNWSARKHRLMIDVTGEKWDNEFLSYVIGNREGNALREFYLGKIKQALADYNANPKNNPPMKDENGNEVVFP